MANKDDLYSEARRQWPLDLGLEVRELSQGEFICSPSLVDLYRGVEEQISPTDEWKKVGAWSFYQALWELAERAYDEGVDIVYPRDVQRCNFDRFVLDNLSSSEWTDMRLEYLGRSENRI